MHGLDLSGMIITCILNILVIVLSQIWLHFFNDSVQKDELLSSLKILKFRWMLLQEGSL